MSPIGNSKKRFIEQKSIMNNGELFKMICGAGNEDADEVYKLCLVYTLAGAKAIDMSANLDVVKSAVNGVEDAEALLGKYKLKNYTRPYLTVSIGMPGDHHVRKAKIIENKCTKCNACIPVCPTDAIPDILSIIESRCIGCGACGVSCQDDAIGYSHKEIEIETVLKDCVNAGIENIELHASVIDDNPVQYEWEIVNKINSEGFNSVCLDRGYLSNHALKTRIEKMLESCAGRMIVQADGIPMSGSKNDFRTTLQAIATADIIDKFNLPVFILLSGGTNSLTIELSKVCGVPYAGVSIGTFARHFVFEYINHPEFPEPSILKKAVKKAQSLVNTCVNS